MDRQSAERVLNLLEARGQLDRLPDAGVSAARACLDRARSRLAASKVLVESQHWESAYTTAYDAYRTAADAVVLALGCRVPAVSGAHRIATDIAHSALWSVSDAFAPPTAERFRDGRHESEYFDPERPVDKTEKDAEWAVGRAQVGIDAVAVVLRAT